MNGNKKHPSSLKKERTKKAQSQSKWVKSQVAKGRVQLSTWIPKGEKQRTLKFIGLLRNGTVPSKAFARSFPKAASKIRKSSFPK